MTELAPSLVELARRLGIATEYQDWTGHDVRVCADTLVAVLAAFGVAARTEEERNAALTEQLRSYWARSLPATIVARAGAATRFWVHVTHGAPADVWLRLEDGTLRGGVQQTDNFTPPFELDGRWIGEASFVLPADLPLGYHRVQLRSGDDETGTALIVTPDWVGLPEKLGNRRAWAWPPSSTACGPDGRGVSAISPTWLNWRCGRLTGTAPTMSWSTRCTRRHPQHPWSRRRTCRPRGATSTLST
ncbi:4-alpha-glucanotransferase/amylomaltase/disproportionating enzyme domain protein [Mycobacterium kansasii]|uniref:4-alpha-glucanotransferase/amylomaltase/disproportionating enzyme domain protein n=1 Tax=Mycobacterium kansasii TaxID=1768 RepID=A0A1V3X2U3_MYCKA|nr:4-alpha-glucanotransferase/amylomaltase/disproportionating enzyme domain protein [Mycobacterium kansasii]